MEFYLFLLWNCVGISSFSCVLLKLGYQYLKNILVPYRRDTPEVLKSLCRQIRQPNTSWTSKAKNRLCKNIWKPLSLKQLLFLGERIGTSFLLVKGRSLWSLLPLVSRKEVLLKEPLKKAKCVGWILSRMCKSRLFWSSIITLSVFTKAEQVSQKDLKTWLLDFLVLHYGPLLIQGIFQFHKQPPLYIHTINSRLLSFISSNFSHLYKCIKSISHNLLTIIFDGSWSC